MTRSSKSDSASGLQDQQFDNLTAIKGIGAKTQDWLRQSLNVHTFQDLAALSADEVETQLKAEGRIISRNVLDLWIAQAARAAEEIAAIHQPAPEAKAAALRTTGRASVSSNAATKTKARHRTAQGDWKPFASFIVEFQYRSANGAREQRTTAHHMEADKEVAWSGIEGDRLTSWMLERLPPLAAEREKRSENGSGQQTAVATIEPVNLAITGIRVLQSPETDTPLFARGEVYPGFVEGAKSFALETTFDLSGPGAADTAKSHSPFQAQVYAHNLATAETIHLGDTTPNCLADSKFRYTARLAEASLAPGVYRLDCVAMLTGVRVPPGHQRLPRLQVL